MTSTIGSPRAVALLPAFAAGLLGLTATNLASAETVRTVNDVEIDSTVLDFYVRSRTQGQGQGQATGGQASPEQREQLLSELADIYLLSTQEVAKELASDPDIAAQIELQRRGVLAQAVASRFFSNAPVSDEEIQAAYAAQQEEAPPLQFKARHILVESQGEAEQLIQQLDDGADFAGLAETESTGPSGPNGGDLGWFSPNQMVKPFSDAVAALEDGNYTSAPIQTQFGWHVILREDSRQTEAPPLDSVRDQIRQQVLQAKFQNYLEDLRTADSGG